MSAPANSRQPRRIIGQERPKDVIFREIQRETPVKERWITKYHSKSRDIDRLKQELAEVVAELSKLKRKDRLAVLSDCGLQERSVLVVEPTQPPSRLQSHALPPGTPEHLPPSQKRVASLSPEQLAIRRLGVTLRKRRSRANQKSLIQD